MAKFGEDGNAADDLDAFFHAAGSDNPLDIKMAAANLLRGGADAGEPAGAVPDVPPRETPVPAPAAPAAARKPKKRKKGKRSGPRPDLPFSIPPESLAALTGQDDFEDDDGDGLKGKFVAVEAAPGADEPFVLIPAHVYSYVPWWGWTAIGAGLLVFVAGFVLIPVWSLDRFASRLGDGNEANAHYAMRTLVMNGDERTVNKLYDMASSSEERLTARLRAVDAMSLIGGVPEVDRALLRLELSGGTNEQVREAAIAARKQREAARTRGGGGGG